MKDKNIEITIKVPRVRMSDCTRLTWKNSEGRWEDIDNAPEIYPIYPLPKLSRKTYYLDDKPVIIPADSTINAIVREVCKLTSGDNLDRCFLHTLTFMKDGNLIIFYEIV